MLETLKKITKKLTGNLLIIGSIDNSIVDLVLNNPKIIESDWLVNNKTGGSKGSGKLIYLKNMKKNFKKKDIIIVNYNDVKKSLKDFIINSKEVANKKIYLFSDKLDFEFIIKSYSYFNCFVKVLNKKNGILLEINCLNKKKYSLKFYVYYYKYILIEYIKKVLCN